ncbi:RNase H-like domain-containing protein, partial [Mycobacterium kansasii]
MGALLTQDDNIRKERAIDYLSKTLIDFERRYSTMEKLCLSLYFAATKLR